MRSADIEEELAQVRDQLLRLRQRELQLRNALHGADGTPPPLRPGWPIRRLAAQALH